MHKDITAKTAENATPVFTRRTILGGAAAAGGIAAAGAAMSADELAWLADGEAEDSPTATGLETVIANYTAAYSAWINSVPVDEDLPFEGPLHAAVNDAVDAFITFQCTTAAECRRKIEYVVSDLSIVEEIEMDFCRAFIYSLAIRPHGLPCGPTRRVSPLDEGPLLADGVTGTSAYAELEASRVRAG